MVEAQVRVKGTEEWKHLSWGGISYYADHTGATQLQNMVRAMQAHFPRNEYRIMEVKNEI